MLLDQVLQEETVEETLVLKGQFVVIQCWVLLAKLLCHVEVFC